MILTHINRRVPMHGICLILRFFPLISCRAPPPVRHGLVQLGQAIGFGHRPLDNYFTNTTTLPTRTTHIKHTVFSSDISNLFRYFHSLFSLSYCCIIWHHLFLWLPLSVSMFLALSFLAMHAVHQASSPGYQVCSISSITFLMPVAFSISSFFCQCWWWGWYDGPSFWRGHQGSSFSSFAA